jgi:hypothetical protein
LFCPNSIYVFGFSISESVIADPQYFVSFVLAQYHQGQMPRLVALLCDLGVVTSKRHVVRLLTAGQDGFLAEARDVLWAGLTSAACITVDDTGARHKETNGFCTQIGNAPFAWFGTTGSKNSARNLITAISPPTGEGARAAMQSHPHALSPSPTGFAAVPVRPALGRIRRRGPKGFADEVAPRCPRAAAREEYAAYCVAGLSDKLANAGG